MSVTSFIGIVSKARAHILRLTSARLQDLVASDWAARAVLRYWRLRGRTQSALKVLRQHRRRPSVNLVGHMLVLGLGFVLVVPGMTGRAEPTRAVAAQHSVAGSATWTTAARARNAVEMREVAKASTLEERPAPPIIEPAPAIGTRVQRALPVHALHLERQLPGAEYLGPVCPGARGAGLLQRRTSERLDL